jgi:hypothetical protein
MSPRKTREVIQSENITPHQLRYALCSGRFIPPGKDASGDFIWFDADVVRLREALRATRPRRRREPAAQAGQAQQAV